MKSETTRVSLLSRVRDPSDQAAWREFESRYGDLIARYACARGMSWSDAEDVRQRVLMELSTTLRNFQYDPAKGQFRRYLGRIVQNIVNRMGARPHPVSLDQLRDSDSQFPVEADPEPDPVWEQEWVEHHFRRAMQTVRDTFEPKSVEMFDRILAGEPIDAIASAHAATTQAVHKVKQRIRDRLRELIDAQIREEDDPDGTAQRTDS